MSERTIADFPPGTRVVRTAAPSNSPLDVPEGTRGEVVGAWKAMETIAIVRFDNGAQIEWGTCPSWPDGKWPLACIAPICTRDARPDGRHAAYPDQVECGRELPCAVHDAPVYPWRDAPTPRARAAPMSTPTPTPTPTPEACGCAACMAPARRPHLLARLIAGEVHPEAPYFLARTALGPGATPPAQLCRWCRGPCRRPITHGED